ncbi:hypothetical protein MLD38_038082 [Melastoma candidum]|uniref:Uncharacterized protein n=1 Tax=Melastoma candidum TaxID=119954 RepID=A0ACB9KY08_9MYRT|nr:hypothetical protein MLD38_038082 [Melastoma candidum]
MESHFCHRCPLSDTVVDKLTVKIVLPEGSEEPSVVVPFEVKQSLEKKYSYLDVVGRTMVVLEKTNVVPEHSTPFQFLWEMRTRPWGMSHSGAPENTF